MLTANPDAPKALTDEQFKKVSEHPQILKLRQKSINCTARLRAEGYPTLEAAKGTQLYNKKIEAQNKYRRLKTKLARSLLERNRAAWFRKADTIAFEDQFSNSTISTSSQAQAVQSYNLQERAEFVTLIHQHETEPELKLDDDEGLQRRLRGIQVLADICQRQDTRRDLPKRSTAPFVDPKILWQAQEDIEGKQEFPMVCRPRQCVWCLGDTRKTYEARIFQYSRVNKMLDEADKHLQPYTSDDEVPCPHPMCKAVEKVLANKIHFKSHLARDHGIYLRACH